MPARIACIASGLLVLCASAHLLASEPKKDALRSALPRLVRSQSAPQISDVVPPSSVRSEPTSSPGPISLQPQTIAIIILPGARVDLPLSDVYASARHVLERKTALRILPLDVLGMSGTKASIRVCAGNPSCFAQRVRTAATDVDLLLTIALDQITDQLLLALRVVDVQSEQAVGASAEEVPVGMSLAAGMEQQLSRVLPDSIWEQVGRLEVTSNPTNAEVSVGAFNCASPCVIRRMIPGTYPVTVRMLEFTPWQRVVTVSAGGTAHANAVLVAEEDERSITSSPLFWGAVGLVAIGAGVLTFFLAQPSDPQVDVCIATMPDQCN
ncbi:MAG: PEGA domain-containing protein [Myxococcota bacterium]